MEGNAVSQPSISASFYMTTYVDQQPMRVHARYGSVDVLLGEGVAGTQHLILPAASARALGSALIEAATEAEAAA